MKRLETLSKTIVDYSLKLKENDRVLITCHTDKPKEFVKILIEKIVEKKAIPFLKIVDPEMQAHLLKYTKDNRIKELGKHSKFDVDNYDCFINIRYNVNDYEDKDVSSETRSLVGEATKESDLIRINERRWVLLNYPSHLDAYKAGMPNNDFFNYSLDVMTVDYKAMYEMIEPLKKLMEKTKKVRIVSPGTDLTFSIEGMPVIPCCGESNIPDGEIFTAPIRDSVNGVITYNTPSPYKGNVYNDVKLVFENGKIIDASSSSKEDINEIFNIDEGARYIGEFSLGLNPKILHSMGDILYDEKIIGSLHFTPGSAYRDAYNGNESKIHWDLVLIQRKEYGGGEVYFDHTLIRKDGLFVLPELQHLNYDLK